MAEDYERRRGADPLLIETSITLKNMNERLFGGPGQPDGGALHYIMNQHEKLSTKIDANKQELLDKIDSKKKETDAAIDAVKEDFTNLDSKVNRWSGALGALQFCLLTGLTYLGVKHHG
jgi:hypothetical protein